MRKKIILDKDRVKSLYLDDIKSAREIATELGVSRYIVEDTIKQLGITRNKTEIMNLEKIGNPLTDSHKLHISEAMLGIVRSDETKKKISETLTGRKRPDEVIEKIVNTKRAKHDK